jgi:hypothetical protein
LKSAEEGRVRVGISVAHTGNVMRSIELITIYLAAGASFGVSHYLRARSRRSHVRAFLEGVTTALLWPMAAAAILLKRLRHMDETEAVEEPNAQVEAAVHAFVISVNKMLEASRRMKMTEMEQTLFALREGVQQYVGLAGMKADRAPAHYEMELARISGRRGDDLLLAGHCTQRRNTARIKARFERERSRLLRKLAELRVEEESSPPACLEDSLRAPAGRMSEARLEIYTRAAALFALLEDERAAEMAAHLLEREPSHLSRLQEINGEAASSSPCPFGEERWTEHAPQLIYTDRPATTTSTQD